MIRTVEEIKSEIQCDAVRQDLFPPSQSPSFFLSHECTDCQVLFSYRMNVLTARSPLCTLYSDSMYNSLLGSPR